MKKIILIFVLFALSSACKKSPATVVNTAIDITGTWVGFYVVKNNTQNYPQTMKFSSDGKLNICYKSDCTGLTAAGSWKLEGNKVSGSYVNSDNTNQTVYFVGTLSSDNKKIDGTFGLNAAGDDTGTFTETKQ